MGTMSRHGEKAGEALVRAEDQVGQAERQLAEGQLTEALATLNSIRASVVEARLELADLLRGVRQGYVFDGEDEDEAGEAG